MNPKLKINKLDNDDLISTSCVCDDYNIFSFSINEQYVNDKKITDAGEPQTIYTKTQINNENSDYYFNNEILQLYGDFKNSSNNLSYIECDEHGKIYKYERDVKE